MCILQVHRLCEVNCVLFVFIRHSKNMMMVAQPSYQLLLLLLLFLLLLFLSIYSLLAHSRPRHSLATFHCHTHSDCIAHTQPHNNHVTRHVFSCSVYNSTRSHYCLLSFSCMCRRCRQLILPQTNLAIVIYRGGRLTRLKWRDEVNFDIRLQQSGAAWLYIAYCSFT